MEVQARLERPTRGAKDGGLAPFAPLGQGAAQQEEEEEEEEEEAAEMGNAPTAQALEPTARRFTLGRGGGAATPPRRFTLVYHLEDDTAQVVSKLVSKQVS